MKYGSTYFIAEKFFTIQNYKMSLYENENPKNLFEIDNFDLKILKDGLTEMKSSDVGNIKLTNYSSISKIDKKMKN